MQLSLTFCKCYRTQPGHLTQRSSERMLPSTILTFIIDLPILLPVMETLPYVCAPLKTGESILDHFSMHESSGQLTAARELSIL